MADNSTLVKQLLSELAEDVNGYRALAGQLKQQYLLLNNRDSRALVEHNAKLDAQMAKLNQHAARRSQYLASLGLSNDNHGMQALFGALPAQFSHKGSQLWQQLYELTLECQQLNNQNGRLLAQQKQMVDKLLKPEQQYCYGPAT